MSGHGEDSLRVPSADELQAIGRDAWGELLVHARGALNDLEADELTPPLQRLRASPTSRLAAGRVREELATEIAAGGPLWRRLHERLEDADPPDALAWLVAGVPPPDASLARDGDRGGPAAGGQPAVGGEPERERLREQAGRLRRELDEARRRADGAEARAETLERKLADAHEQIEEHADRAEALEAQLDEVREQARRDVERERRRHESRIEELEGELTALRRREQQREQRERQRRERQAARTGGPAEPAGPPSPGRNQADPGRPSELPAGIEPGTTEAAVALLTAGRPVLIDGYNVTLTHREHLSLEEQRLWLVRLADRAASRFDVRPEVVFDGQVSIGAIPGVHRRVSVRFSQPPVSADDDIVFGVEALEPDRPVLVVTDDRDLRTRVEASHADVVGTGPFVWAVS